MRIRGRIKELRRVKAGALRPNPRNGRTHPKTQREVFEYMLAEVGYADALWVRELPDKSLELVDGHLRQEMTPDQEVPVLVLDINEAEAGKLLMVLDPLAAMAEPNKQVFEGLLRDVASLVLQTMIESIRASTPEPGDRRHDE